MCRGHPPPACQHILFIREGRRNTSTTPGAPSRIVPTTQDWRMRVNLSRKLQFPQGDHHHKPLPRHSDMVQWHQDQTRHRTNCPMGGRSRICLRQEEAEVFTECHWGLMENHHLPSRSRMLQLCWYISCSPPEGHASNWSKPVECPERPG